MVITEEWRDVVGYEGKYQVSNCGRVKSVNRYVRTNFGFRLANGRVLKQRRMGKYLGVSLGKDVYRYTHRLVAEAFLPNDENCPAVNHKDENRDNNHLSNLEWCTHRYNQLYNGKSKRVAEKKSRPVIIIDLSNSNKYTFKSRKEAVEKLKINPQKITDCCKGRIETFKFKNSIWRSEYIEKIS